MEPTKHISICVCTYKRPHLLARLLQHLFRQQTDGRFTYSMVVVDNDQMRSAAAVVSDLSAKSNVPILYCVEARQNIALARNKAVENASGDFVCFIDDDEFPVDDWLLRLISTCEKLGVDGVLGPVLRHFDEQPPKWLLKSRLYERPRHTTGFVMSWREARTGNVLIRRELFGAEPFRPEFRAGEDQDFFRRMIDKGHVFVWCDEAVAYEVVPPTRWKCSIMLKRALLRGASAQLQPTCGIVSITKSLIAIPSYLVALPFALILGYHKFIILLIKLFDHLGKILAVVGINPIKEQYVSEQ